MSGIPTIEDYNMPTVAEIPSNIVSWSIDPKRAVLLLHDMQNYFVRKIPSTKLKEDLLYNMNLVRKRCITHGIPIAYTAQPGDMNEQQRGLLRDFWGVGMKATDNDRKVVEELTPDSKDWLFTKWRYSAFHKSDLLKKMRDENRDQIIICGVYAHIGVLMTAVEAFSNDIETFLVADAIADFSKVEHLMTLNYAARCCAVNVFAKEVLV